MWCFITANKIQIYKSKYACVYAMEDFHETNRSGDISLISDNELLRAGHDM